MTDQSQEMLLHEEVPTVQRVTVLKEKVRLSKAQETNEQKVDGEVRKERVDIDPNDQGTEDSAA